MRPMLAAGRASSSAPPSRRGSPHVDKFVTRAVFPGRDRAGADRCVSPRASNENAPSTSDHRVPPALILIGGRGCGKSALCRRLMAADSRFVLRSLDDMIVEEAGMEIPQIVQRFGWRHFRDLEFEICQRVADDARRVRTTGTTKSVSRTTGTTVSVSRMEGTTDRVSSESVSSSETTDDSPDDSTDDSTDDSPSDDSKDSPDDQTRWFLIDAGGGVVVDLDEFGEETYSSRKVEALRGNVDATTGKRENVLVYIKRDVRYLVTRTSGDRNRPELRYGRRGFPKSRRTVCPYKTDPFRFNREVTARRSGTSCKKGCRGTSTPRITWWTLRGGYVLGLSQIRHTLFYL